MKKVSIIIPIYNMQIYLARCLNSIINQTYQNIEIILVNDGSTDDSILICEQYAKKDDRIKIINKTNGGVSSARNSGIECASGDFICFIDPDDWIDSDGIENMIELASSTSSDLVRLNYYINTDEKQSIIKTNIGARDIYTQKNIKELLALFLSGNEPCYSVLLLIDKNLISSIKGFDTSIRMMEDVIFYTELILNAKKITLSNKRFYHYYQHNQSASKSPELYISNSKNILEVNKRIKEILESFDINDEKITTALDKSNLLYISNYLFKLYSMQKNVDSFHKLISYLNSSEDYQKLAENFNLKNIKPHLYVTVWCVKNNKPNLLNTFFKIRLVAHKVKRIFI